MAIVGGLLVGCSAPPAPVAGETLPIPDGEYAVGVTDLQRFSLTAYYPAKPDTGRGVRPYASPALLGTFGATAEDFGRILPSAQVGADPVTDAGAWPLVVLAPGGTSFAELFTALAEQLASHGYVVVMVQPDVAVEGGLTGGTVPPTGAAAVLVGEVGSAARLAQLVEVIDLLDDPLTAQLVGPVDPARIAVGGHSIGGSYALDLSLVDSRVTAAFDLDGGLFGPAATTDITVPALVVMADLYSIEQGTLADEGGTTNEIAAASIARLRASDAFTLVALPGARHYDVTDLPVISAVLPEALRSVAAEGAGTIGREGTLTTNAVVLRFLDAVLATNPHTPTSAELVSGLPAAVAE